MLQLDTPGGLSDSMDQIVHAELAAKIPVVVYVWPEGARAASAGFVILQAADVAALAPTTNAGSAIPISSTGANIGSDLRSKIINDARAQVRALATEHGRNATLAEGAVTPRSAACPSCPRNWTAREAVAAHVADVVAPRPPEPARTDRRPDAVVQAPDGARRGRAHRRRTGCPLDDCGSC